MAPFPLDFGEELHLIPNLVGLSYGYLFNIAILLAKKYFIIPRSTKLDVARPPWLHATRTIHHVNPEGVLLNMNGRRMFHAIML
jgi:hypothetical protein